MLAWSFIVHWPTNIEKTLSSHFAQPPLGRAQYIASCFLKLLIKLLNQSYFFNIYGTKLNNLGGCLKGRGNGGSHESVTCSRASTSTCFKYWPCAFSNSSPLFNPPQLNFMLVKNWNSRQGFKRIFTLWSTSHHLSQGLWSSDGSLTKRRKYNKFNYKFFWWNLVLDILFTLQGSVNKTLSILCMPIFTKCICVKFIDILFMCRFYNCPHDGIIILIF